MSGDKNDSERFDNPKFMASIEKNMNSFDFWLLIGYMEQDEINNKSKAIKTFGHCIKEMNIDSPPQMSIAIASQCDPNLVSRLLSEKPKQKLEKQNQQHCHEKKSKIETRFKAKESDIDEQQYAAEVLIKEIPCELILAADEIGYQQFTDSRTNVIIVKASNKFKKLYFPVDCNEKRLSIMSGSALSNDVFLPYIIVKNPLNIDRFIVA
ncbi:MAG: hypothetical protein EZS28_003459 [Streblomastix strix]|uniref:DDE-1 domain-containing protein n=1 Tax=Streblomastix strix TaxID=222440 RepID=A0A5J4X1G5_9EUKA|nr:MAG: hypothetical protein EZS28_003459 [Streblomastix strix]